MIRITSPPERPDVAAWAGGRGGGAAGGAILPIDCVVAVSVVKN
jgi:hypothetical protein